MYRSLVVFLALLCSCQVWASPRSWNSVPTRQKISLSLISNNYDYAEVWVPPGKSTENGWLFGVGLEYSFQGGSSFPLWAHTQFDFSPSGTTYGSTETDPFGQVSDFTENTKDWFSRIEVDGGFTFYGVFGSNIDLTPYTGYGYRFWRRDLSNHNDLSGYREEYSWSYVPVGLRSMIGRGAGWSVGLDVAARIMVSGSIYIALPQFSSPTLTLGNIAGWHVALPVEYSSPWFWGAGMTFWYEYSGIGQSNDSNPVVIGEQYAWIHEPPSRTHQFGLTLTWSFHF